VPPAPGAPLPSEQRSSHRADSLDCADVPRQGQHNERRFGEEGETLVRSIHGRNYERLAALKRRYDPTDLFRSALNIVSER
jgi:hypothetical protein